MHFLYQISDPAIKIYYLFLIWEISKVSKSIMKV